MSVLEKASRVLQVEIAELQRLDARLGLDGSFEKAVADGGLLFQIFRNFVFRFILEYSGPEYLPRPALNPLCI